MNCGLAKMYDFFYQVGHSCIIASPSGCRYDRYFYNYTTHEYTIDRYLDDLQSRFGGIDSLLMWPTYPHLGIDDRSQFDMFRLMPGGLGKLRNVTQELHDRGVKVLWPYNPWSALVSCNVYRGCDRCVCLESIEQLSVPPTLDVGSMYSS